MTNESNIARRIWVAAAIVILGAGVVGRELVRSGTVGDELLSTWYGQAGLTVLALTVAGSAVYLINRAYRRRSDSQPDEL